jgi:hypothetical protein
MDLSTMTEFLAYFIHTILQLLFTGMIIPIDLSQNMESLLFVFDEDFQHNKFQGEPRGPYKAPFNRNTGRVMVGQAVSC